MPIPSFGAAAAGDKPLPKPADSFYDSAADVRLQMPAEKVEETLEELSDWDHPLDRRPTLPVASGRSWPQISCQLPPGTCRRVGTGCGIAAGGVCAGGLGLAAGVLAGSVVGSIVGIVAVVMWGGDEAWQNLMIDRCALFVARFLGVLGALVGTLGGAGATWEMLREARY